MPRFGIARQNGRHPMKSENRWQKIAITALSILSIRSCHEKL